MRETYSTLLQATQDLCVDASTDTSTGLSDSQTFLAKNINSTIQYIFSLIKNYKTQPIPRTFSTVADQIYYHYPPGLMSLESVTIDLTGFSRPLKVIHSQKKWDELQEVETSGDFAQYIFPRQSDFGIWPTPSAVRTGTVVGNFIPQRLSVPDYSVGTVTIAQNSQTVTGSLTEFTPAMVGRWIVETNSDGEDIGNFYRLSGFTDSTTMTLETFFEESSLSGSTFKIAQSPELPEELHEYIPYRAAAAYYRGSRRDAARAQSYMNYFYTGDDGNPNRGGGIKGGVIGVVNEYRNKGRGNSQIIEMQQTIGGYIPEAWRTTLEEAP